MLSFDEKMIEARTEDVKMKTYEKLNYSESIPLRYMLITYNCPTLWNMENNMVTNRKGIYIYFLVGYMLNPELNINRELK